MSTIWSPSIPLFSASRVLRKIAANIPVAIIIPYQYTSSDPNEKAIGSIAPKI